MKAEEPFLCWNCGRELDRKEYFLFRKKTKKQKKPKILRFCSVQCINAWKDAMERELAPETLDQALELEYERITENGMMEEGEERVRALEQEEKTKELQKNLYSEGSAIEKEGTLYQKAEGGQYAVEEKTAFQPKLEGDVNEEKETEPLKNLYLKQVLDRLDVRKIFKARKKAGDDPFMEDVQEKLERQGKHTEQTLYEQRKQGTEEEEENGEEYQ